MGLKSKKIKFLLSNPRNGCSGLGTRFLVDMGDLPGRRSVFETSEIGLLFREFWISTIFVWRARGPGPTPGTPGPPNLVEMQPPGFHQLALTPGYAQKSRGRTAEEVVLDLVFSFWQLFQHFFE